MKTELTEREQACIVAAAQSKTRREMALDMNVSIKAVEYHIANAAKKLGIQASDYAAMARWAIRKGFISACLLFLFCVEALAAPLTNSQQSVTLIWEPSPDTNVMGYRLYWGLSSRQYKYTVDVGPATSAIASNLTSGATYYFAATAYDGYSLESDFSEEVSYTVPAGLPAPTGLSIVSVTVYDSPDLVHWSAVTNLPVFYVGTTNGIKFFKAKMVITNDVALPATP